MSVIEVLITLLKIAENMHEIEVFLKSKNNNIIPNTIEQWLAKINLFAIHNNKYELSTETFNEGLWILKYMETELYNMKELSIADSIKIFKQKANDKYMYSMSRPNDAFIYHGLVDLINFAKEKLIMSNMEDMLVFLKSLFVYVRRLKIGEKIVI